MEGFNIQVKTVFLKTDYFRVARHSGAIRRDSPCSMRKP